MNLGLQGKIAVVSGSTAGILPGAACTSSALQREAVEHLRRRWCGHSHLEYGAGTARAIEPSGPVKLVVDLDQP